MLNQWSLFHLINVIYQERLTDHCIMWIQDMIIIEKHRQKSINMTVIDLFVAFTRQYAK